MDVMRPLISVHRFKVYHVADDMIFVGYAVATVHVSRDTGDVQSLAAIVALDQADLFGAPRSRIDVAADRKRCLQTKCNFGLHIC